MQAASEEQVAPPAASSASINIANAAQRHASRGLQSPKEGPYGRSITYVPSTGNLPPQMR